MITAQIIVLSILFFILVLNPIRYFETAKKHNNNLTEGGFMIYIIAIAITFSFLVTFVILNNRELKCTEYVKIENVYKLKQ